MANESPNVESQKKEVQIPVSIQSETNTKVDREGVVNDANRIAPVAISESALKHIGGNIVKADKVTEQAYALNGGGMKNITVNNLIDDNSTAIDGKPQSAYKGGTIGTSTVKNIDANEKALIENDVVLTGNGVADTPFVADDVIDENSTQSKAQNESTKIIGIAQFGNDIQARATDAATEKNKTVSTEENENTKVVKVSNFHFETTLDSNNDEHKVVSVNVAMKNNQTRTIIFQFPIDIYVDHVNKQTGFITRLKKKETSTLSDVHIANEIRNLIKKSKENIEEVVNTTVTSSSTPKPEQLQVDLLRNK